MELESGERRGYIIRRFKESDLDRVIYINRRCLPENYTPDFFLYHYREFPDGFLVAEIDGTVVGYIMTRIDRGGILPQPFSREFGKVKGHVISLAVMPHARRRGIAESLMREAIQNIRSRGVKEVYLEVRVTNNPAINLYRKLGFKVVNVLRRYYADGEDAYVMSLRMD